MSRCSLNNLPRSLVGDMPKQWDIAFPHVEFVYNRSRNQTIQLSTFEIVYEQNPSRELELILVPHIGHLSVQGTNITNYLHGIHKQVK